MHEASVLLREVLVLNEAMEFEMRRAMGISETDFQAMQHLMTVPAISPGELAVLLHLTSAAVTTVIDRLERAGYIQRTAHPTDRRMRLISVTDQAKKEAMDHLMPMILESDASVRTLDALGQRAVVEYLRATVAAIERRTAHMRELGPPHAKKQ